MATSQPDRKAKTLIAVPGRVRQAWAVAEDHEQGEILALELYGRLQDADAAAEDAEGCFQDVRKCMTGKMGPVALASFKRQLVALMLGADQASSGNPLNPQAPAQAGR